MNQQEFIQLGIIDILNLKLCLILRRSQISLQKVDFKTSPLKDFFATTLYSINDKLKFYVHKMFIFTVDCRTISIYQYDIVIKYILMLIICTIDILYLYQFRHVNIKYDRTFKFWQFYNRIFPISANILTKYKLPNIIFVI